MDCRTSLSLAKSGMDGKSKNRRRPAEGFKIFHCFLRLLINKNRNKPIQRKGMEIATFLPIADWKVCLVSYWLTAGIWAFPSGFPIPSKNCPEAIQ
jgi:hypothetical protein